MRLREIDAGETSALLECITQLSEHHNRISVNFKGSFPRRPYKETIRDFTDSMKRNESLIAVVEEPNKVVGFCKIDIADNTGKLDYLVVLQEYRGKGCGRQLMDWAMTVFKEHHISHIDVKVVDGNDAIHFYEKYGFRTKSHILSYSADLYRPTEEL